MAESITPTVVTTIPPRRIVMELTTITTREGVTYVVTRCLVYWLGFAGAMESFDLFEILAPHVAPAHRIPVWAQCRALAK